jgi:hypothetical protein
VSIVRRTAAVVLTFSVTAAPGQAQQKGDQAREAYFRAVADFFSLPPTEVSILAEWHLPADEIPVVLFVAHQAGVSAEALVALRSSGRSWAELSHRYQVDASHFYLPLPEGADPGVLRAAYTRFRDVPPARWSEVALSDADVVTLVNVRVLAQTLHVAPEAVLRAARSGRSFVDVYASMLRMPEAAPSPGV